MIDVGTQTSSDKQDRVRDALRELRSDGHGGGVLLNQAEDTYEVPPDVVFIRTTERYLTKEGELLEVVREVLKKKDNVQ